MARFDWRAGSVSFFVSTVFQRPEAARRGMPAPSFGRHLRDVAAAAPLVPFRAVAGGIPIVLGLFLAHRWGRGELAAFTVAQAIVTIIVAVTDWGATRALPRELATLAGDAAVAALGAANALRAALVAAAAVIVAGCIAAGFVGADAGRYLGILFPLCALSIVTTDAVSERVVSRETGAIATAVAAGLLSFAALGAMVLARGFGPPWLVAAYVAGKVVEAAVLASGRWWVLAIRTSGVPASAAALWPFAAQMILGVVYSRLAVFTVERATGRAELGVFAVALAFQNALLLIPTSLALTQFPELTRRSQAGDGQASRRIVARYALVSGAAVLLGAAVLVGGRDRLAAALDVPAPMMPFVIAYAALAFVSSVSLMAGFLLQARGEERAVWRLSVLTAALALLYQTAALRAYGLWGIVAAVGAAELTTIAVFAAALARTRRVRNDRDG
jgi:O-antigen/teichoic acid export membrane protein